MNTQGYDPYNSADDPLFDGETYSAAADGGRLRQQLRRVQKLMSDGNWRTLGEIAGCTGDRESSVSARLRDLRKAKFGGFTVERRARGQRARGLFEYRVIVPNQQSEAA